MIKNLLLLLLITFIYSGCKKENAGGTLPGDPWYIKSIKGLNGFNNSALDFTTGKFTFKADGTLEYENVPSAIHHGKWSSSEVHQTGYCYTGADGNQVCDSYWDSTLELEVELSPGQQKRASFISLKFIDANNFTAVLAPNGTPTHQYSFARN